MGLAFLLYHSCAVFASTPNNSSPFRWKRALVARARFCQYMALQIYSPPSSVWFFFNALSGEAFSFFPRLKDHVIMLLWRLTWEQSRFQAALPAFVREMEPPRLWIVHSNSSLILLLDIGKTNFFILVMPGAKWDRCCVHCRNVTECHNRPGCEGTLPESLLSVTGAHH